MRVNGNFIRLGQGQPRVFGGPSLDYCYGPQGFFALWRDEAEPGAYVRGYNKNPDQSFLSINDQIIAARSQEIRTPWLHLVADQQALNRRQAMNMWTHLWDGLTCNN